MSTQELIPDTAVEMITLTIDGFEVSEIGRAHV